MGVMGGGPFPRQPTVSAAPAFAGRSNGPCAIGAEREAKMFWMGVAIFVMLIVALSIVAGVVLSKSPRRARREENDAPVIGTPDL